MATDKALTTTPKWCPLCSTQLPTPHPRAAKYCSTECAAIGRRQIDVAFAEKKRRSRGTPEGRTCDYCSGPMPSARRLDSRYCSDQCGQAARNRRIQQEKDAAKRACPGCGGALPKKRRTFCSEECRKDARQGHAYGLTVAELEAMTKVQDGRCAICGTDKPGGKMTGLVVDHCHATGAVRALLCDSCNNGLGRFRDDPALLRAAADYLERHALT